MRNLRPFIFAIAISSWGCSPETPQQRSDSSAVQASSTQVSVPAFQMTLEGRAFVVAGGVFGDLSDVGLTLHHGPQTTEMRFARWGRGNDLTPVDDFEPAPCDAPCTDRMEYRHPGVTEWWTPRDTGLEQGWDLMERPAGADALTLHLDVTAPVDVTETQADFGVWTIDHLKAWDSQDTPLDIWMEPTDSGFAIRVDDTNASWPIHIDPLVSLDDSLGLTKPSGTTSFGVSLAGGGDINGDGLDDIVVTDDRFDGAQAGPFDGRAWVYFGGGGGAIGATLTSPGNTSQSYGTCSLIADINGDGRADLLIAEPASLGEGDQIFWYLGGSGSFDTVEDGFVTIPRGTDCNMEELNVNGDGFMDVAIRSGNEHRIFHGSADGLVATSYATASTNLANRQPGSGDYNNDGFDDIFVGLSDSGFGTVLIEFGSPAGVTQNPGTTRQISMGPSGFGAAFARLSSNRTLITNDTGGHILEGTSVVGSLQATDTTNWATIAGPIGDMDGDGLTDFYVASLNGNGNDAELMKVYPSSNPLGVADSKIYTCSNAVSTAGDFNNDGLDDLVCLAGAGSARQVHVYLACIDADEDGACAEVDCDDDDNQRFPGNAEVCDGLDNDCIDDVPSNESDDDNDGFRICEDDCDDTRSSTFPGATELCDGRDNDCDDGVPTNESDGDNDGFRICEDDCNDALASIFPRATELCDGLDNDCVNGVPSNEDDGDNDGFRICEGDCNDALANTFPGANELCDGLDNDCVNGVPTNESDDDNDGFRICEDDCDDALATTFPGATELCDGLDNDCVNGVPSNEDDADDDGFRICEDDCNDALATTFPGATELCDGLDNDCIDGVPTNESDDDNDGFRICANDCDDALDTINPDATEVCNDGIDDDCDPSTQAPKKGMTQTQTGLTRASTATTTTQTSIQTPPCSAPTSM